MAKQLQTLLTGFGPFGSVTDNPTTRLVRHFATLDVPGHALTCLALPVSYARAPQLMQAALAQGSTNGRPFDIVLMLGVASSRPHWSVETQGCNVTDHAPDCDGFNPGAACLALDGEPACASTLPTQALVAALQAAGLPTIASETAGGYLCNALLYTTLRYLQQTGQETKAGFLHVPADDRTHADPATVEAELFSFPQQVRAVEIVLQTLAQDLQD